MSSYPNYISIIKFILGLGALVAFFASGLAKKATPSFSSLSERQRASSPSRSLLWS